ncbi:phenylalanine--tRNA ligase subunit beta [Geomobilimonas luticola]|uniref:Phenylalanine--tRNA ligase beta subunit n=1 Tax=Geomobilimonas luticola TaxID=1114878 RepID=A0ABS5SCF5_9BACT|nr:phenylalanine--tRNA ligase subunit beta [Geomobilimonas luticola]MBT0653044.1 phenylalanine--tRNA ligase subunit beta [Geomobilimonas luticola]
MIVTYNWLKEFVDLDLPPSQLADLLTMLGLEVEAVTPCGEGMDDVVVAVVEERAQHPNADKLSLCRVNNGREVLGIVCGAQNFKAGDKVALAQIGATLPGDFKIKRSKIRGEESCGMLCSEKELGLADESAGIMILPPDLPLGIPVFTALGLKDTIFEIGLTPNRADCLSVIGIAREIAAKLGKKIRHPAFTLVDNGAPIADRASVVIEDPQLCPRYTARYIEGCRIAPSPRWLANRLNAVGMRSINNVVDVTNYVLLEYGHPLHAFDFELLAGGRIIVRRAGEGEKFTTLDGQERTLTSSDLTIRDASRGVALAGIMGGENSEIKDTTTNILLESAYFNPTAIRLTSKRLGLHTESSHRFERGADIAILTRALDRAAALIAELAGGTIARGLIDVHPEPVPQRTIAVRLDRVNRMLGIALTTDDVAAIFRNLEFDVVLSGPDVMAVTVPSFRVDLEREIDLVEEVARLYGFENIPVTMPTARVFSDRPPRAQRLEKEVRSLLVAQGFNEVINFSFIAPDVYDRLLFPPDDPRRDAVKLRNPLVAEQSVMRTILLPSLLETTAANISHRELNLRLFEMRRVYHPRPGQELPAEPLHVAAIMTGRREPEGWCQGNEPVDFFDVKGIAEALLAPLRIPSVEYGTETPEPFYHPGKCCTVLVAGRAVGSLGEIHPDVQENFGLSQPVYYLELDFNRLIAHDSQQASIHAPSRYPDVARDIAMLLDDGIPAARVLDCVRGLRLKEIESVAIFDLYKGEHIPAGQKSLAIRVRYRSPERTLTDDEVTRMHQRVIDALVGKLNITVR